MASARKITVEFVGDNRDLNNALDDTSRRGSKFGSALKKAGKVAALGLAAGAVIAGKALFDMTKAAIEDEKAQEQLAQQLRKAAGATDEQIATMEHWISSMGTALGVADDDLRPALSKLATATGDVNEAQRLAALAMDISAGSGKSLSSVTDALVKAQNGSVGGLGRLGIATKDAEGKTKSFAQIQQDLADKFQGAAADAADTTAGKMARLKIALSEAGEEIGAKLIPVVAAMAEWFLNKGLPAIEAFGGWMRDNLGPIFSRIGDVIRGVFGEGTNSEVSANLTKVKDTIMSVVSIIQTLWDTFGSTIMNYTRNTFQNLKQIIGGALDIIAGIFKVISSVLKGDWAGAWEGIKQILRGALDVILGVLKQALNMIKTIWSVAWIAIKEVAGAAWDGIKALIRNGADAVVDGIRGIPGRIRDLADNFKAAGKAVIDALINGIKNAGDFAADFAANVWTVLKGMINAAIDRINNALEFTISVGPKSFNINPPDIPHLARGGVVKARKGGTLAVLGEGGQDEAVVPLGRSGAAATMGPQVTIQLATLDPRQAWDVIVAGLREAERRTGRQMLVSPA